MKQYGLTFEVLHDPRQVTTRNYQITGYPETFIIDRNGVSVRHQVGIENMAWSTDFPHHGDTRVRNNFCRSARQLAVVSRSGPE